MNDADPTFLTATEQARGTARIAQLGAALSSACARGDECRVLCRALVDQMAAYVEGTIGTVADRVAALWWIGAADGGDKLTLAARRDLLCRPELQVSIIRTFYECVRDQTASRRDRQRARRLLKKYGYDPASLAQEDVTTGSAASLPPRAN